MAKQLTDNRWISLGFILIGGVLQSIAAFQIDEIKPYSAGVLMFAAILMTLGRWDKVKELT